jgi:hypothetical protein
MIFISLPDVDKAVLRDKMICEFLSTNSGSRLPSVLMFPILLWEL